MASLIVAQIHMATKWLEVKGGELPLVFKAVVILSGLMAVWRTGIVFFLVTSAEV